MSGPSGRKPALPVELLACPGCHERALFRNGGGLGCPGCGAEWPRLSGLPVLHDDPLAFLGKQRRAWEDEKVSLVQEELAARAELRRNDLLPATRRRLELTATLRHEQLALLRSVCTPLEAHPAAAPKEGKRRGGFTGRAGYVFRDWSWETNEASAIRELAFEVVPADADLSPMAVLGAGPCRLPYDLRRRQRASGRDPGPALALDRDVFVQLAAERILGGETLDLVEVPSDPLTIEQTAIRRTCRAPEADPDVHGLVADANALPLPLATGAFGAVLTPFSIEVIHPDGRELIGEIARLLRPGGIWIYVGFLTYRPIGTPRSYNEEEILAFAAESGLRLEGPMPEAEVTHVSSPATRGTTRWRTRAFVARKEPG